MPAFDEETFGPVAALTRVPDIDSAIHAANASQFGLSGNLWTRDVELARKSRAISTPAVFSSTASLLTTLGFPSAALKTADMVESFLTSERMLS